MLIAIDIQGLQSESRYRGIGRYVRSIIKAILVLAKQKKHNVVLCGNGAFPLNELIDEFAPLVGRDNIRFWVPAGECAYENVLNHDNNYNARIIREAFFKNLKADIIYVPTMFEGYQDNSVLSVGEFDKSTPVVATLYDLIPLHNPAHYLDGNANYKKFYLEKISFLKRCAKLLAISEFAKQEGQEYFSEKADDIINVSTACDDIFQPHDYSDEEKSGFLNKYSITKPFLLYSGGADERKNLPALIKALSSLPEEIQKKYEFVIAGRLSDWDVNNLKNAIKKANLECMPVRFTGYVTDDELVALYNLCHLFIFPSWHEGFGLPALEAMACGAVVIGAGNTSLPEVIGIPEALFDPLNIDEMRQKIEHVLIDNDLYNKIKEKGKSRACAFSWERSATVAMHALEEVASKASDTSAAVINTKNKKKLAYFTPLSPARSGIALYSEELLPALAKFYDIDVIIDPLQSEVNHQVEYDVIDVPVFLENVERYDRIIYQMGNSVFHEYMHEILEVFPGIVCLHDFYLSNYYRYKESQTGEMKLWSEQLLTSHGYKALIERGELNNDLDIMYRYPSNFNVLSNALAVIVHSNHARELAKAWYHSAVSVDWEKINLLRAKALNYDRQLTRQQLNIDDQTILICSFGIMDFTKLNHRVIEALGESLAQESKKVKLVFVGELGGSYKDEIEALINKHHLGNSVEITGWASDELYKQYLIAADVAVQLRSLSRGETSAAVLDCMNYGLPTIVNANGSMAELPDDKVIKLAEDFTTFELIEAIDKLCLDRNYRLSLGASAAAYIHQFHSPDNCAELYYEFIEKVYGKGEVLINDVIKELSIEDEQCNSYAQVLSRNFPKLKSGRKIFFDVSLLRSTDLWTGIERVTRALLIELLKISNGNMNIVPVYLEKNQNGYSLKEANQFITKLYPQTEPYLVNDREVDFYPGDVYFSSELACDLIIDAAQNNFFDDLMRSNVHVSFMIHDILPVTRPEFFPPGSNENFSKWLNIVASNSDKIICVTDAVRNEVDKYMRTHKIDNSRLRIEFSHHGADIAASRPNNGISSAEDKILAAIDNKLTFLMVGTLEPRKGHLLAVSAFEKLWRSGHDLNLVIVGKEGWKGLPDDKRRTIPKIISAIENNEHNGHQLFWLNNASDELLSKIYAMSDCLLYPSEDEGFGLPLIEASQHKKPLISRDVPVLREVAKEGAYYFNTNDADVLAEEILKWCELFKQNAHPDSSCIPWITWSESAKNLVSKLLS